MNNAHYKLFIIFFMSTNKWMYVVDSYHLSTEIGDNLVILKLFIFFWSHPKGFSFDINSIYLEKNE